MERKYIDDLLPGMTLARPVTVLDKSGRVLLEQGLELSREHIKTMEEWGVVDVFVEDTEELKLDLERRDAFEDSIRRLSIDAHHAAVNTVRDTLGNLSDADAMGKMNSSLSQILEVLDLDKNSLIKITLTRPHEDYIFNHAVNVCILSLVIAGYLGFDDDDKRALGQAALLHDVGLSELDPELWDHMEFNSETDAGMIKEHIRVGAETAARLPGIMPAAVEAMSRHHERADGSGSPGGLDRDGLDDMAHILIVADMFDSLTRPFAEDIAMTGQEALQLMFEHKLKFDTRILRGFLGDLSIYPIGSIIKLNTGAVGLVVGTVKNQPFRPILRIISDPQGIKLSNPFRMDLSEKKNMKRFIDKTLRPRDVSFKIEWD